MVQTASYCLLENPSSGISPPMTGVVWVKVHFNVPHQRQHCHSRVKHSLYVLTEWNTYWMKRTLKKSSRDLSEFSLHEFCGLVFFIPSL